MLAKHYVEDKYNSFRVNYTIPFLRWAMNPPGFNPEWIIGVRGGGKLVAFVSAIPVTLVIEGQRLETSEVNFLCVH